ncbi:MAG: leucine-rich repeat domain-containing protein [Flavobacteriales bacterium]|nr:leucine-rich repeat domain-containing protein [Flavobacteriales bacterium]
MKRTITRTLFLVLMLAVGHVSRAQLISFDYLDTCKVYESIDEALISPTSVYRLDLSKQKLKEFPVEIFQLVNLNELKLSRNKIIVIPSEISKLTFLQKLDIQRNALDTIKPEMCELRHLRELNLAENFITGIPDEIENLADLKYFILWQNPIEYYPNSLGMLEKLEVFDLLHNLMTERTQDRLRNILPKCNIVMSPPCNCGMQDE